MFKTKSKGFTLVELLVVIAIIGLLASVVIVSVGSARAKARDANRIADAKAVQTAIELYRDGNQGAAPDALADLTPTYLGVEPVDPRNTGDFTYVYYFDATDDETIWAMRFTTEQDSSLGPAGIYCVNSASIVSLSETDCGGHRS